MEPTVNKTVMSKSKSALIFPLLIWFLAAFFFFYEFLLQTSTSVLRTYLTDSFSINATQFGLLSSFYFLAYGFVQIPAGMLLDRFGPRILLTIATGLCGFGAILMSVSSSYAVVLGARAFTGVGSGFAMLGALVLTANWFSSRRFALLHGLTLTIGISGAVFGGAPLGLVLRATSWQTTLMALGIVGIVLTLLMWIIIRDRPKGMKRACNESGEYIKLADLCLGILKIIKYPQTWLTALYGALMYAPTAALSQWTASFLPAVHGYSLEKSAWLISVMYIGWIFGSPLFGAISDFIGRRKVTLYVSTLSTLGLIAVILYVTDLSYLTYAILYFTFGFFTCGFVPSFSIVREQHEAQYSGTALGFMNMINSIGPGIAPLLIGILLDLLWSGTLLDSEKVYTLADYKMALTVAPICLVCALIVLPFIKETYCQTADQRDASNG